MLLILSMYSPPRVVVVERTASLMHEPSRQLSNARVSKKIVEWTTTVVTG